MPHSIITLHLWYSHCQLDEVDAKQLRCKRIPVFEWVPKPVSVSPIHYLGSCSWVGLTAHWPEWTTSVHAAGTIITRPMIILCTLVHIHKPISQFLLPLNHLWLGPLNKTPLESREFNGDLACINNE